MMIEKTRNGDAQIAEATRDYDENAPLRLLYGGSIVVQLGSQLYPSVTAAVAELLSNAWDADARNVWVTIPFGDDWTPNATIEVLDDGIGMSRREAQLKYLVVGRERRRIEGKDRTPAGRLLHGRKGIGKLAAFGTGRRLEVVTQQSGAAPVGFRLDYEALRALEPAESAEVEEFAAEPLIDPDGQALQHGTRVRLTSLQTKRRPTEDRFRLSMSRRFSLDQTAMQVLINRELLPRFDMDLQYRFPPDAVPAEATVGEDGLAVEMIDDGDGRQREVRWWIGFLERPVKDELLQGISVLVRGKQAQRPFKFERSGGTESQLAYEYLVGEVHADWIDDGVDDDGDLIASNRDTLQLEDPRLQPFIAWGRRRLRWALTERGRLQAERRVERWTVELPQLEPMFRRVSSREQQSLGRVAERLGRIDGLRDSDIADVMQQVLDVREHRTAAAIAQEIRTLGDVATGRTWQLAQDAATLERRTSTSIVEARLALLDLLTEMVGQDEPPPDLSAALVTNPWLVDLRLDRSRTRRLGRSADAGDAVILVGPPVWDPDAPATILAAFWNDAGRPPSDEEWLQAVMSHKGAKDAQPLLVGRAPVRLDATLATTWTDCLARSVRQHRAWLTLLRDGDDA